MEEEREWVVYLRHGTGPRPPESYYGFAAQELEVSPAGTLFYIEAFGCDTSIPAEHLAGSLLTATSRGDFFRIMAHQGVPRFACREPLDAERRPGTNYLQQTLPLREIFELSRRLLAGGLPEPGGRTRALT